MPNESLRMCGMNLDLHILRMLEDTFSLGEAQMILTEILSCLKFAFTHLHQMNFSISTFWTGPFLIEGVSD